jgi:hypothetical protein
MTETDDREESPDEEPPRERDPDSEDTVPIPLSERTTVSLRVATERF